MLVSLVIGLSIGSIYGLTSMGLVLTYRMTGVFNLAHGAMGMLGTYVFWQLRYDWGWPLPVALVLTLVLVAPAIGAAAHFLVFRWVAEKPVALTLVAGIAVLVASQGLATVVWGSIFKEFRSIFPFGTFEVTNGFNITTEQLGTMAVTLAVAAVLLWLLHGTRLGLRMRAVVDNRALAGINGEDVDRVQLVSWVAGSIMATLSGILISPFLGLSSTGLTLVVIQAMACAVIGRLSSLPLTYLGGLGLGVLEAMLVRYLPSSKTAQGLKVSAAFLVLYAAVVLGTTLYEAFPDVVGEIRGGLLGREGDPSRLTPLLAAFVGVAVILPQVDPSTQFLLVAGIIASIAFQSFVLITGLGGQVSLCQASFIGVGAMMYGQMAEAGWPIALSFVAAPVVAALFGLSVSIPAVRVRGLPLALLTLAFGLFMDSFVFSFRQFGGESSAIAVARPHVLGLDLDKGTEFGYFALLIAFVVALLVRNLASGRTGRILASAKSSPTATEAFGTPVRSIKLLLFTFSSMLAGLSGVLVALQIQTISPTQFNISYSIMLLAVAVLGGVSTPVGALFAGLLLYVVPDWLGRSLSDYQQLLFGLGAIAVLVARRGGVGDMFTRLVGAVTGSGGRRRLVDRAVPPPRQPAASPAPATPARELTGAVR